MSLPRDKLTKSFPGCPVEATLSFLDGKWKGVILFHLVAGTLQRIAAQAAVRHTADADQAAP
jgi:DNA-binding HxlR family transcriptional regulator